jgi:hypothetical protein
VRQHLWFAKYRPARNSGPFYDRRDSGDDADGADPGGSDAMLRARFHNAAPVYQHVGPPWHTCLRVVQTRWWSRLSVGRERLRFRTASCCEGRGPQGKPNVADDIELVSLAPDAFGQARATDSLPPLLALVGFPFAGCQTTRRISVLVKSSPLKRSGSPAVRASA